ncbi:MAG: outer membrane protein assembly factor BamA [Verrucomicrobia bacterium]|nr:outer membrane protein assembly factor BamA [Verrucomicrobiota bacterium]
MNFSPRRAGVLLALLLAVALPAAAQTFGRIQKIEIKHIGPPAASDELVRANIRVKEGDTFSRNSVDDDVRNLYATGYFYNIRVQEEPVEGGVKLNYVLIGRPLLTEIRFEGNKKYSASRLKQKVTSKKDSPLDERKLFTDSQEIQKYYQKQGFQKTQVKYELSPGFENTGRATVTFVVTEAPKVRVIDVEFVGATAFPRKKLAKQIKTRRWWMWSWLTGSGVLKDEEFEEDKEKLAEFYRNEGYIDFEIKEVKLLPQMNPKRMVIQLVVFEGKQYKVGSIKFEGNSVFTAEEMQRLSVFTGAKNRKLELAAGKTFTPDKLSDDLETLRDFYGGRGYIDARIQAERRANTDTGNMDLTYKIEEHDKSYIEKVEIKGNVKTKDKVIRRELAVAPGEVFDMVRVNISKERLKGTDFFEKVDTQVEDTDVPSRKNLVITVDEKDTGNVQFGAGFSSVESIVGYVEVTQKNFDLFKLPPFFGTGAGQKLQLRATYGSRRQDYLIRFIEPWLFDRKLTFGVDLYHRNTSFQSSLYDEQATGVKLSLERPLWSDFLRGGVSYTFESAGIRLHPEFVNPALTFTPSIDGRESTVTVSPPLASQTLIDENGRKLYSKVGASLTYSTLRGFPVPFAGQRTEFITELAGGPLGGEVSYYKMELHSSWYFRGFLPRHVLELTGETGVADAYDGSRRVPLFNRFFLGGPRTLRGYKYDGVGPHDDRGEPIGGNTYVFGTAEYTIPIIENLRFAIFYDIGNVYTQAYDFNVKNYNDDYGLGFRLNIPNLGPLRLDYGIPLHHDKSIGGGGHFQFDVGYTRNF